VCPLRENCHKNLGLNCAGPDCLKDGLLKGLIVYRPNSAGPDCPGSDSVGPDCAGPHRTCTVFSIKDGYLYDRTSHCSFSHV
jgi:hypothetical protein